MSAAHAANQKQATEAFINAWKKLSVEDMVALRAPDCIQPVLPFDTLGAQELTNEVWVAQMTPIFGALSNFKATILSVTHDTDAKRSVVHARTTAEAPFGPYRNEHVVIMTFTEDGKAMKKVEDMMDSAFVLDLQAKVAEFMGK